jgi:hypothetical protein
MKTFIIYAKSKVTGANLNCNLTFWVVAESEEKAIEEGRLLCREKNAKYQNCTLIINPYE